MEVPQAVLLIADNRLRGNIRGVLEGLNWRVLEAGSGAEAMAKVDLDGRAAVLMDSWLPDLEVEEFIASLEALYPGVTVVSVDGSLKGSRKARHSRHGEILHALRSNSEGTARMMERSTVSDARPVGETHPQDAVDRESRADRAVRWEHGGRDFPEFAGDHPLILDMCRRIRLVAPRKTSVLVQGPSGTGKELVARALHRMSSRAGKPFVAINCAAIPESLLEAELFGYTKGSFTGASQARIGRIESADEGSLFLDEIGDLPLTLQAKLLRFLESREIQKIGENRTCKVDVRVIAASHHSLPAKAASGEFRTDLFYRLAVFLIATPSLRSHMEDLPQLAERILAELAEDGTGKTLTSEAFDKLSRYEWPGNVRELSHVLERAYILAEGRPFITANEVEFACV